PAARHQDDNLRFASKQFLTHGLRELPVVNDAEPVLGFLAEHEIAAVYLRARARAGAASPISVGPGAGTWGRSATAGHAVSDPTRAAFELLTKDRAWCAPPLAARGPICASAANVALARVRRQDSALTHRRWRRQG